MLIENAKNMIYLGILFILISFVRKLFGHKMQYIENLYFGIFFVCAGIAFGNFMGTFTLWFVIPTLVIVSVISVCYARRVKRADAATRHED